MLQNFIKIELVISISLLLLTFLPLSGLCHDRVLGNDCESWFIFGVNIFGPIGISGLVSAAWSYKIKSWRPQYLLLLIAIVVVLQWLGHVF